MQTNGVQFGQIFGHITVRIGSCSLCRLTRLTPTSRDFWRTGSPSKMVVTKQGKYLIETTHEKI